MTLRRVRICMRRSVASTPGVGYVAVTRVKHVEHLVFEEDLPAWEVFQEAKVKPAFRQRRRMELRFPCAVFPHFAEVRHLRVRPLDGG